MKPVPNDPLLSIGIVTYGRKKDDLLRAVESVFACASDLQFELIVVDNDSVDDTLKVLAERYPSVLVIRNRENIGYAPAMNMALAQAKGQYMLCLSLDAEVLPGSAQALIDFMRAHPQCGLAGPRVLDGEGGVLSTRHHPNLLLSMWAEIIPVKMWLRNAAFRRIARMVFPNSCGPTSNYDRTERARLLSGGILMTNRKFLDDVGLMDGNMPLGPDDYDWCYRALQKGYEIWYVAESTMIHRQKPKEDATKLAPIYLFSQLPSVLYFYQKIHKGVHLKFFQGTILLLLAKWRWKVWRHYGANSINYEAIMAAQEICVSLNPQLFEHEVARKWAWQCERFFPK
jgi:GT2 family glycosyltransferase